MLRPVLPAAGAMVFAAGGSGAGGDVLVSGGSRQNLALDIFDEIHRIEGNSKRSSR